MIGGFGFRMAAPITMANDSQEIEIQRSNSGTVCSEEAFADLLLERVQPLVRLDRMLAGRSRSPRRRFLLTLTEEATGIEEFLDEYDARYNRTFAGVGELIASLRVFASVGHSLRVILKTHNRRCPLDGELEEQFRLETSRTAGFVEVVIRRLLGAACQDLVRLCGPRFEAVPGGPIEFVALNSSQHLPHTIGADDASEIRTHIGSQANQFLAALRRLEDRYKGTRFTDTESMRVYARDTANEEQSRFLEAKLRNQLSAYDTFLRNSVAEQTNSDLPEFRDILITTLQLQQMMTQLAHFYERHENDIRGESSRRRVAELVDKNVILDRTLNYCLFFVARFMSLGRGHAERMLEEATHTKRVILALPDNCMLHARPASLIARVAQHHGTDVKMVVSGESCSANSIMQVIMLAGQNPKAREVGFSGDERPIADLEALFAAGLGEDGEGSFPEELSYLKHIPRRDGDS